MGVLPWDLEHSKSMTWDIERMLDVKRFDANVDRQHSITQNASFDELEIQV